MKLWSLNCFVHITRQAWTRKSLTYCEYSCNIGKLCKTWAVQAKMCNIYSNHFYKLTEFTTVYISKYDAISNVYDNVAAQIVDDILVTTNIVKKTQSSRFLLQCTVYIKE